MFRPSSYAKTSILPVLFASPLMIRTKLRPFPVLLWSWRAPYNPGGESRKKVSYQGSLNCGWLHCSAIGQGNKQRTLASTNQQRGKIPLQPQKAQSDVTAANMSSDAWNENTMASTSAWWGGRYESCKHNELWRCLCLLFQSMRNKARDKITWIPCILTGFPSLSICLYSWVP